MIRFPGHHMGGGNYAIVLYSQGALTRSSAIVHITHGFECVRQYLHVIVNIVTKVFHNSSLRNDEKSSYTPSYTHYPQALTHLVTCPGGGIFESLFCDF